MQGCRQLLRSPEVVLLFVVCASALFVVFYCPLLHSPVVVLLLVVCVSALFVVFYRQLLHCPEARLLLAVYVSAVFVVFHCPLLRSPEVVLLLVVCVSALFVVFPSFENQLTQPGLERVIMDYALRRHLHRFLVKYFLLDQTKLSNIA